MSDGLDVLSLLDSDLLEYSATLEKVGEEADAWRALCNLHERVTLLELHAKRMAGRHPVMAGQIEAVGAGLAQLGRDLEEVVKQKRPEAGQLLAISEIPRAARARMPLELQAVENIRAAFVAASGSLDLPLSTSDITPLLHGFHNMESIGRWTGPSTTSTIALPLDVLRTAGVTRVRLCMKFTESYGLDTVKILFGPDLEEAAGAVSISGQDLVIALDKVEVEADRIVISTQRTRRYGQDPRQLGVMVEKLVLEDGREV